VNVINFSKKVALSIIKKTQTQFHITLVIRPRRLKGGEPARRGGANEVRK